MGFAALIPTASAASSFIGFGFSLEVHEDGEVSQVKQVQDLGVKLYYGSF